ncbi:unnamed protein product, partial [Effrenium voratum]
MILTRSRSRALSIFQRRLFALRAALAAAAPQQRKEAIELLSPQLRRELLWLMETDASGSKADKQAMRRSCSLGVPKMRLQAVRASLWTMRTSRGHYHAARLTLGGVVVATRATRSLKEAERMRRGVQILGQAAAGDTRCAFESRFRDAVGAAGDLGLTFSLVLDLRPWVGKKVQSPTVDCVEEALSLRRRLTEAAAAGWPALRREWLSWMTAERRQRWKSRKRTQDQ